MRFLRVWKVEGCLLIPDRSAIYLRVLGGIKTLRYLGKFHDLLVRLGNLGGPDQHVLQATGPPRLGAGVGVGVEFIGHHRFF